MGIPSYYRKLLRTNASLIRRSTPTSVDWLWMDFNCLLYYCLRSPALRPYPGLPEKTLWEEEFLKCVVTYTKDIVREVNPSKGVYIAIDGVVPMAKMKQQRLRRFKSAWMTEHGIVDEGKADGPKWDTNAITPGTAFMGNLRKALEKAAVPLWTISSSDEPGEGEHKIMERIRSMPFPAASTHAVYGMDADLVVLSLLTQNTVVAENKQPLSVWLFRESEEDGFEWFSVDGLRDIISSKLPIRDYCFAMSFLGNDFLPSALGLKMRDDGHEVLMDLVAYLCHTKTPLLDEKDVPSVAGLGTLFKSLGLSEERRIRDFVLKKLRQGVGMTNLPVGDPNWALCQGEETCLLEGDWIGQYERLQHFRTEDGCRTYLQGLGWIWDYYRGKPVCYNWYYPWSLPPLWQRLAVTVEDSPGWIRAVPVAVGATDIQTAEQLCLVLPPASWELIPVGKQRQLRTVAPYLFPSSFDFCSLGKRFFWECEPKIPIPSILEVKRLLSV